MSGVREEETAVICITRDASFSGEPPEHSSVVREEARGRNQESSIQPGTSLFSCLILPLLLGNFCWHAHSHTKQGILVTE